MTTDFDSITPSEETGAISESRRDFLSKGRNLVGASLAAPALVGLGALGASSSAQAWHSWQTVTYGNIRSEPNWSLIDNLLGAGGLFRGYGWDYVQIDWHYSNDGNWKEGYVHIYDSRGEIATYKFNFYAPINAISDYGGVKNYNYRDYVPGSLTLTNIKTNQQIVSPRTYTNVQIQRELALVPDETFSLPAAWLTALNAAKASTDYFVHQQTDGALWAGARKVVYTITQIANGGVALAVPVVTNCFTVLQGYLGGKYWTVGIPVVDANGYNGLLNSFDAGMGYSKSLVLAGSAAVFSACGVGWVAYGTFRDMTGLSDEAIAAVGIFSTIFITGMTFTTWRSLARLRGSTAISGLMAQYPTQIIVMKAVPA